MRYPFTEPVRCSDCVSFNSVTETLKPKDHAGGHGGVELRVAAVVVLVQWRVATLCHRPHRVWCYRYCAPSRPCTSLISPPLSWDVVGSRVGVLARAFRQVRDPFVHPYRSIAAPSRTLRLSHTALTSLSPDGRAPPQRLISM